MITEEKSVSTFALIVDKLRMMDEAELKLAYVKLFKNELAKEWEEITKESDFGDVTDEEIVMAVQKNRNEKHQHA